jgi:hypothetical protein
MVNIRRELRRMWRDSAGLTATAVLMLAALGAFGVGMLIDAREIGGAPALLKPAKFAISTAIFCATVAWLYRYLTVWPRVLRATARVIAATLIIEVAIIALQAARGTTSHFNVATAFDGAMFSVMGACIAILWLASVVVLAALLAQRFEDPVWGWWLRLGMLVTVVGAAAGGMMLGLTSEQRRMAESGARVTTVGAHTVGGPDGGPGLPGTGWSTRHGDLRIPHFLGLHGIQVLAIAGWLARRRGHRFAFITAGSYSILTAVLTWQALRGQPLIAPDGATLIALGLWAGGTVLAFVLAQRSVQPAPAASAPRRMAA